MKPKIILILVAAMLIFAFGIQAGFSQEKEKTTIDAAEITRKLNEVLANQAEILKQLDEIRKELDVIKVRASH